MVPQQPTCQPTHVLIVNAFDEREMYAEALRAHGLTVTTASTGRDALEALERDVPDVIVQGAMLPDMPATQVAVRLKTSPHTKATPLILLSGYADQPTLAALRQTGADAVLVKPCLPDDLLREIERLLAAGPGRRRQDTGQARRVAGC